MRENNGVNLEDKLLLAKADDMMFLSQKTFQPKYSVFLDQRQQSLMEAYIKNNANCHYCFWGGYENAERRVLCVYNDEYEKPTYFDFPIKCIEFSYKPSQILSHRDFLGALMASQVKREVIGDIVIDESNGKTKVLVLEKIAGLLMDEIRKIGSIGVKTAIIEDTSSISVERKFIEISGTVSSLRADSVVSLATKQSREKSSELIKKVGIEVCYKPLFSVSALLKEGDVFSIRGYGKFILKEINGLSKKGKLRIIIQKYI